ncbi:preprotein translocase subunit SecA [Helicobacter winghamensis]|uniref:Protein translocase subunit SecA n=1 Tax=Helicobacter winghamensis TaxID=157268 RepID=A0A2N3PJI5_9HELI|nr:preprotein translocase subunit SecA [Helicobacter winghamensis]EEO26188.1 preprotein translocase, SecA subunit [Helicobacter winghamensis ATCC BAA-430]PKT77186.1 preprotein translocase subunit SecA [Helicobacter winghamensis]PKT77386.1 preprotein translocase subunit SecA [Helicobacter winghamensis]PKT77880.1 preprotein translocase subunit SecA [Helicobacter winghamensis]PKT81351.1 preprotein translocase subunit SecA [Helicobacter winghamensis]
MILELAKKIFSNKNDRLVGHYRKEIRKINALEEKYQSLSDTELKTAFNTLKQQVQTANNPQSMLNKALYDSFAITREASKRVLNMRHFDVQLIGGIVLHEGKIAEMKTGEGKTLVATLPVCLNAMVGKSVHIVTVNDYLAQRDAELMRPLYEFLGYSVGIILSGNYDETNRLAQYSCDIVYGTNNEFGFDYLRDNMKYDYNQKVQKHHHFAIVDEVDSILIDEARTPLIISGPANRTLDNYKLANEVALKLKEETHYIIDEKNRTIMLTEVGISEAEKLFKIDNLYSVENAILAHHLDQALKANKLFKIDKDYVLRDGEVIIVDEFTGRLSEGRRFSEGLHQALEAKEGVQIKEESQTLADITYQNYFRFYEKLAGMTGTAQTEASEFLQIYNLDVISIPTNIPIQRKDLNDLIYKTEVEKFKALTQKIVELHKNGQPILVGTASIEKSEKLHELLKKERIPHSVLNAKQHAKEAEIIKDAGKKGAVTIATNMAGRGVDIKIDDEVRALGGLYIIGTERHESRRIDNQLRGRSGRQGDPGTSQFYLSLEDSLLRIFGSDKIKNIMDKLGLDEGEHIESKLVTRSVENAQKKVESMHFEARKHLLEYDDVANEQRKAIYRARNELLDPEYNISHKIIENRQDSIKLLLQRCEVFSDDDNLELLCAQAQEDFNIQLNQENLKEYFKNNNNFEAYIEEALIRDYEAKMQHIDPKTRSEIEKLVYLQTLDNLWREHLYVMDNLKTGIGLRGYNQKDPLVEYKKESYNLFVELIEQIKYTAIKMLQKVQLRATDNTEQTKAARQKLANSTKNTQATQPKAPVFKGRPVRNEPCPCGSGKKYKDCCGKSGPKSGELARKA